MKSLIAWPVCCRALFGSADLPRLVHRTMIFALVPKLCPRSQTLFGDGCPRNSVSRLLAHDTRRNAKQSFVDGVFKQSLGTRKERKESDFFLHGRALTAAGSSDHDLSIVWPARQRLPQQPSKETRKWLLQQRVGIGPSLYPRTLHTPLLDWAPSTEAHRR